MRSPLREHASRPPHLSVLAAAGLLAMMAIAVLPVLGIDAKATMFSAPSVPCNLSDRGPLRPSQVRGGSREHLVPEGAVSLTACGYNGMNANRSAPEFGLVSSGGTADKRVIDRITAQLDRLKPAKGTYSCPMDQGSDVVVTFAYASGPPVVVTLDTGGCGLIDNGQIRRLGLGKVATEIEALSRPVVGIDWPAISGHLRLCGGPSPGRCYIENYNSADRVVATNAHGEWVAMAPVEHGRFHFRLATAGSYTLAFYAGNKLVKKLTARVTSGQTTRVVFPISIE